MERYDFMGLPYATQEEAEAGVNDNNLMTPLKTKQSIEANSPVKTVNGQTGNVSIDGFPVGAIVALAGETLPDGFVVCNGAAVNRNTYSRLYDVIGTKYGAGDGSTTFNLPNLNNNSFLEGSNTAGTIKSAGLPNATGDFVSTIASGGAQAGWSKNSVGTGALYRLGTGAKGRLFSGTDGTYDDMSKIALDLSKSNSIFGKSTTVQPKSVTVKYCIKY